MRALLLELRPSDLQNVRLDIAIGHLTTAATLLDTLKVESCLERTPRLPQKVQVGLYRIAQEALNNIMRHSQAQHARVELRVEPPLDDVQSSTDDNHTQYVIRNPQSDHGGDGLWKGRISLEISDDGVGFDVGQIEDGHIGLSIMHERAKSIGADLRIASKPGEGSKVIASWEDATHRVKEVRKGAGCNDYEYTTN